MPQGDINQTYKSNEVKVENAVPNKINAVEFRGTDPTNLTQNPMRIWARTDTAELKYTVDGVAVISVANSASLVGKADQSALDETNSQVAENTSAIADNTADIAANAMAIANIGNSSPKGTYPTLAALQAAYPTGTTGIYVVTADGNWYYWNGSAWTSGGVYQATAIAANSVTTDMRTDNSNFGMLVFSKPPNFDFTANTITFYTTSIIIFKKSRYFIANGSDVVVDISTATNSGYYGLFYNKTTNTFKLVNTGSISSVTEDDIIVATFRKDVKVVNIPCQYTINGNAPINNNSITSDLTTDNSQFGLIAYSTKPALFDLKKNKQIIFYANTALIFKKARYYIAINTDVTLDISALSSSSLYGLYYNKTSNTFKFVDTAAMSNVTESDILIASFNISSNTVSIPHQTIRDNNYYGLLVSSAAYPNFDFSNNQITFYSNTILIFGKQRYVIATGGVNTVLNISTFASSDQVGVFYNRFTNTFNMYTTSQISGNAVLDTDILIATFNKSKQLVFMSGGYQVNGVNYGISIPTPSTTSRFLNKRANFLGDSITYGLNPADGTTQLANPYPTIVKNTLGLSVANNYGISGSTVADYMNDGTTRNPMCVRYTGMDNTADLNFVFGGTNDWANDVAIGSISDTTKTTFYGALNTLASGLLDKYPTQTIVFATPLHRQGDTVANSVGATLNDYRNAVIAIGAKYGIAVLDLYSTSGFYPDNTTNYNSVCPDGRHPNDVGQQKLANRVSGFLITV